MDIDKLKNTLNGLNKVEVVIGIVALFLLVVGIYALSSGGRDSPSVILDNGQDIEEGEEIEVDVVLVKTGSSPNSVVPTSKAVPTQNFNRAGTFPSAQLISDGRVQSGFIGTYCWGPIGTQQYGICSDAFITDLAGTDPLIVMRNSPVKLKLDTNITPLSLKAVLRKPVDSLEEYINNMSKLIVEQIQLSSSKEISFMLNAEPGEYILTVSSIWQGEYDVEFNFKVRLK
jgi:hypothetical protein